MKNRQSITAILLALLLTLPLASCGNTPDTAVENPSNAPQGEGDTETEAETVYTLPEYDCGGGDLTILSKMEGTESGRWTTRDIYAEELTGEAINDAVYNRNIALQDKYHCVIREERMKMDDMPSGISKFILAGDATYDIIMPNITSAAVLSKDGNLYELQDRVDLSQPWWNAQFTKDTEIGGKNYFANGDISETFMRATYAVFFNKQLISDNGLENPYTLVQNGTWTMDKVQEMGAAFASDSNGDGKMTKKDDNFGLYVLQNQVETLYTSSGEKIIQNAADGTFSFHAGDDRSLRVLESIYSLYANKDVVCKGDTVETGESMFSEGRLLFLLGTMNNVVSMREMETDFGILPTPKADVEQAEYYSYMNTWASSCAAIPVSCADIEKSSVLMEALASYSRDYYTPAYYEVTLKGKYSRDTESLAMLDLIYERRTADLGNLFNIGGVLSGATQLVNSGKNSFASMIESKAAAVDQELAELNEMLG